MLTRRPLAHSPSTDGREEEVKGPSFLVGSLCGHLLSSFYFLKAHMKAKASDNNVRKGSGRRRSRATTVS